MLFRNVPLSSEQEDGHVCCPHRLAWPRTPPFHGGDGGSNPPGDVREKRELHVCNSLFLFQSFRVFLLHFHLDNSVRKRMNGKGCQERFKKITIAGNFCLRNSTKKVCLTNYLSAFGI